MANQLGKRYQCEVCGAIVLCTRAGTGAVQCHDKPMVELQAKRLPSSD